jgi:ferredoxin-NADP reductase
VTPAFSVANLASQDPHLSEEALALLEEADLFFVSSANGDKDMSTNHRGGPKGFVRAIQPEDGSPTKLVWPEYSGNQLYQTLGRLFDDPRAGVVVPDFQTGDALFVSGKVELLVAEKAAALLPRSNLAVCLTIEAARFVKQSLLFRAEQGEPSPYNPTVRKLAGELGHSLPIAEEAQATTVRLLKHHSITPTISRFTFSFSEDTLGTKATYSPGQWVALDFSSELSEGYSHMRDHDPTSLNDDLIRTFTVSSTPPLQPGQEFEITIRKVGRVTDYLFQAGQYKFKKIEAAVKGFGGDFKIDASVGKVGFIAGGVGITPLMSAGPQLSAEQADIHWTMQAKDYRLSLDFFQSSPHLASSAKLYFTNVPALDPAEQEEFEKAQERLAANGSQVYLRRLLAEDLSGVDSVEHWYICTSVPLRNTLMSWLPNKQIHYEDFNF